MANAVSLLIYLLGVVFLGFFQASISNALPAVPFVVLCVVYLLGVRYLAVLVQGTLHSKVDR